MNASSFLRPLAPNENFYFNNAIGIVAESHLNHSVSLLNAQKVLEYLQKYHLFMRTQIIKVGKQAFFHENKELSICLQVTKEPYQKAIHKFISTLIDPLAPFEILIIQSKQGDILATKTHHCLSDGISVQAFHNDFLICLETLRSKKKLPQRIPYPLPPSCLEYVPSPYVNTKRSQLIEETTPNKKSYSIKNMEHHESREKKPQIHLRIQKLNKQQMNKLHQLCKEHKIKLNSLICAALILAAGSLIQANELKFYLLLDIPVNLRPYLNPPIANDQLSSIVSNYSNYYRADGAQDLWELAQEINHDVHTQFNLEKFFKRLLVYDHIFKGEDSAKIELYTSNLGLVRFDTKYYHVQEYSFYAHGWVPLIFTIASTPEVMRFNFLYTTPLSSHNLIEELSKKFIELLMQKIIPISS